MVSVTFDLLRSHVDIPKKMDWTREAISSANRSKHRLLCALHMTKVVSCSFFNSLLYLGKALTKSVYIGFSEGAQSGREHYLKQLDKSNRRSHASCRADDFWDMLRNRR